MPAEHETRLAEIRREIAAGTYETSDKLSVAVDGLWQREFAARSKHVDLTLENLLENEASGEGNFCREPFRQ